MLARGNENVRAPGENRTRDLVAPGEHSFSLFQEENIPWSNGVLLTSL